MSKNKTRQEKVDLSVTARKMTHKIQGRDLYQTLMKSLHLQHVSLILLRKNKIIRHKAT